MKAKLKQLLRQAPRSFSWLLHHLRVEPAALLHLLEEVGAQSHYGLWQLHDAEPGDPQPDEPTDLAGLLNRVKKLETKNSELKRINHQLAAEVEQLRARLAASQPPADPPPDWLLPQAGPHTVAAICLWSDWHWGERIGDGSFSPQVAQRRVVRLLALMQREWEKAKHYHHLTCLYLGLLGDFITGSIHDENRELGGNTLTPTQEIFHVQQALVWGIKQVLKFPGLERLVCVCVHGNHGRLTPKSRITSGHLHSLESLLYWQLPSQFAGEKKAQFVVAREPQVYTDVLGHKLRWCHGDFARATQPAGLHRWVHKQNQIYPADFTLMGHVHHLYCADGLITNGSLVGPTDYGKIHGFAEPAQQVFLLLDQHGVAQFNRLRVQDA